MNSKEQHLVADSTNDRVSLIKDKKTKTIRMRDEVFDSLNDHFILVETLAQHVMKNKKFKWIEVEIPSRGRKKVKKITGKVYNEKTKEEELLYKVINVLDNEPYYSTMINVETVKVLPSGTRIVRVPKDDFLVFYQANCDRILYNVKNLYSEVEDKPDDDGFVQVRNKKKIKSDKKQEVSNKMIEWADFMKSELKKQAYNAKLEKQDLEQEQRSVPIME